MSSFYEHKSVWKNGRKSLLDAIERDWNVVKFIDVSLKDNWDVALVSVLKKWKCIEVPWS